MVRHLLLLAAARAQFYLLSWSPYKPSSSFPAPLPLAISQQPEQQQLVAAVGAAEKGGIALARFLIAVNNTDGCLAQVLSPMVPVNQDWVSK